MRLLPAALLFSPYLGAAFGAALGSVISRTPLPRSIQARTTTNGSCISAPDDACVSLVGLCVTKIAQGQVGSTAFWSDSVCVAAATCASVHGLGLGRSCAGTCRQPTDMASLDYNNVYTSMVGSCASQPGGCPLSWQSFVDWYYNTIQATGTNIYPDSGDDVLALWQGIATWTGFCVGNECADGSIPYTNFNDWFHFSSAVIATTPGTPEYVVPFASLPDNMDNIVPNIYWPCLMDDPGDCWWDYGPPLPGTNQGPLSPAANVNVVRPRSPAPTLSAFSAQAVNGSAQGIARFGRAAHQPPNVPPPVYVNGQLVNLPSNGSAAAGNVSTRNALLRRSYRAAPRLTRSASTARTNTSVPGPLKRAITPDACKTSTDTPTVLPTLTYFCNYLPNICENIRSHPDWDSTTDQMQLTYDPFDKGSRRTGVCGDEVRAELQAAGSCDPLQHDPYLWKVSCDEFPFSSTLEGGENNAVVMGVPSREQDLQGTLQSSITHLRSQKGNGKSTWSKGTQCHSYLLKLVDAVPAGAVATAIGSLDAGSQFFSKPETFRWVTNRHALDVLAPTFTTDTPYAATATALTVKRIVQEFDCSPCDSDSDSDLDSDTSEDAILVAADSAFPAADGETPSPTFSKAATGVSKVQRRQASACPSPTTAAPLPTSSADAAAVAAASSSSAQAAAEAVAAALASASNPSADQAAAAAAAVAAANALGPVAAALSSAEESAALAAAIASSQAAIQAAQSAVNQISSLGTLPDWLSQIISQVSSAASAVTSAVAAEANVIDPSTVAVQSVDPSKDPNLNSGPPPGAPAAACFGAGSQGFLKIGDSYFVNENGKAPATLVDVGSDAYFGLTLPNDVALTALPGCNAVYSWQDTSDLQPDFQVDCSTMELGAYWNGVKQTCYAYFTTPELFALVCGNDIGNVYSCLQGGGLYGSLQPGFVSWATS